MTNNKEKEHQNKEHQNKEHQNKDHHHHHNNKEPKIELYNPTETILFEYLPYVYFNPFKNAASSTTSASASTLNQQQQSNGDEKVRGVIMIIMMNGDVFFYPIDNNELNQLPFKLQPNNHQHPNYHSNHTVNNNNNNNNNNNSDSQSSATDNKNKYSKYNISLSIVIEHKVFTLDFIESIFPYQPQQSLNVVAEFNKIHTNKNDNISNKTNKNEKNNSNSDDKNNSSNNNNEKSNNSMMNINNIDIVGSRYRKPRKVLLSHDKRLLLVIGCFHKGLRCLTVYKINEDGPDYLQLIFYDSSFTYIDACFSSDSQMLVAILARFPNYLFFMQLPTISPTKQIASDSYKLQQQYRSQFCSHNQPSLSSNTTTGGTTSTSAATTENINSILQQESNTYQHLLNCKTINYEPRKIGPLAMIGPAKNALGMAYAPTHIASNPSPFSNKNTSSLVESFEYITWNDEGLGEYCLWSVGKEQITSNRPIPSLKFEWMTKFIGPIVPDRVWVEKESSPKNYIINMEFSPNGDLVMVIVRRENHEKNSKLANGIGIQTIVSKLSNNSNNNNDINENDYIYKNNNNSNGDFENNSNPFGSIGGDSASPWIQVTDNVDQIITSKWTDSLFFGSRASPSILVKGIGIYELISRNNCVLFTNGSDDFQSCSNYLQLGRYHRLWMENNGYNVYLITLTPKNNDYIEWKRVYEQKDQSQFSKSLKMIGYSLIDNKNDTSNQQQQPQQQNQQQNQQQQQHQQSGGKGDSKISNKLANQKKMDEMLAMLSVSNGSEVLQEKNGRGEGDVYIGLQLYRCAKCKLSLMKPLICGNCKSVAYCSKICQKEHWSQHKDFCKAPIPPANPPSIQQYYAL